MGECVKAEAGELHGAALNAEAHVVEKPLASLAAQLVVARVAPAPIPAKPTGSQKWYAANKARGLCGCGKPPREGRLTCGTCGGYRKRPYAYRKSGP